MMVGNVEHQSIGLPTASSPPHGMDRAQKGQQVRHPDGEPLNNSPNNLAYGTGKQNMEGMIRHGRSTV
jgi:hypothetical protein